MIAWLREHGHKLTLKAGGSILIEPPPSMEVIDQLKQLKPEIIKALEIENLNNLTNTLENICLGLPITPSQVIQALAPEDIEDWHQGKLSAETLEAFVQGLVKMGDQLDFWFPI